LHGRDFVRRGAGRQPRAKSGCQRRRQPRSKPRGYNGAGTLALPDAGAASLSSRGGCGADSDACADAEEASLVLAEGGGLRGRHAEPGRGAGSQKIGELVYAAFRAAPKAGQADPDAAAHGDSNAAQASCDASSRRDAGG